MFRERQFGFIDESGNSGLDFEKSDVSSHFVVSAVIVAEAQIPELETQLDKISAIHFSKSEIRSRNVGKNDARRKRILADLLSLDFKAFALVVDKRELRGSGFPYKRSFLKFLNSIVHKKLFLAFPRIKLVADEIGSKEFMGGFEKYVYTKHPPDLFNYAEFGFANSNATRLIQLSDFIAGTLLRCFDATSPSPNANEFLQALRENNHLIPIEEFPERRTPYSGGIVNSSTDSFDPLIAEHSVRLAQNFVDEAEGRTGPFIREQIACANVLLFQALYGDNSRYLPTHELIDSLQDYGDVSVNSEQFGRSVIGPLRDGGVLIASNTTGYKLVSNRSDLRQFVAYFNRFIEPMLTRLRKARNNVRLATKNEIDILDDPEFEHLKAYFDNSNGST